MTEVPAHIKPSILRGESPVLLVTVEPAEGEGEPLSEELLQRILKDNGAENWFIHQDQLGLLEAERLSLKAAKTYRIAECRDAQAAVRISGDRTEARITIVPPCGGRPISGEKILERLKQEGVTHGILESRIPELVAQGSCEDEVIAEALPPKPGTDAAFEPLVKESDHKGRPGVTQDGKVDLHDLSLFISVAKGTPLLKRIPPTPGRPGKTVDGKPIAPEKVKDQKLNAGPGTGLSPQDPNLLIATVDGLPIFGRNSAKVLPKLELAGVNYQTGNIEFNGSVHIRGPVQQGFKVEAAGDIVALDTVDSADLTAGGSIHLLCGMFGRKRSRVAARGNIRGRFLSECTVHCSGDLVVEGHLVGCTVVCEGRVEVGQRGGKGQIYGGKVLATKGVRARVLGSVAETPTVIEVSPSPALATREHEIRGEIKGIEKKVNELDLSLGYLRRAAIRQAEARIQPLAKESEALRAKLEALQEELAELSPKLQIHTDAKIAAEQVHPGVTVAIAEKREVIKLARQPFVFENPAKDRPAESPPIPAKEA